MARIFIILIYSIITLYASAEKVIILHLTANRSLIIPYDEAKEIIFSGCQINIGQKTFQLDDIIKYEFSDAKESGIEYISGDKCDIVIDPRGYIDISKINTNSTAIYIHNTTGMTMPYLLENSIIDISKLSAGIYIISIGDYVFKFSKR